MLADAALALWQAHRPRTAVRLLGVAAAGIGAARTPQLGLFGAPVDRRAALNAALDRVVARFGEGSVARGGRVVDKGGLTTQVKRGMGDP